MITSNVRYKMALFQKSLEHLNTHSSLHTLYSTPKENRRQKTLVVTLLDLKNVFREVSHSLIPTVLQFHHISREMQSIISELYSGFSTSIAIKTFLTSLCKSKKEFFKVTVLVPYYLTCFLIPLFKH